MEKTDLLDRQGFVDRMIFVAETLSKNKKSACYALNGTWGVGKSFVLDMFETQANKIGQEETTFSRFLIFHYNCWEYDYYEEPVIAIVASMLDQIEENVNLLQEKNRSRIISVLKVVGNGLFHKATQLIEEKYGIPIGKVTDIVTEGVAAADSEREKKYSFDQYISFKETLKDLQKAIHSLAEDQTVIFVVDELDRCLPEYTIKVLERLHHLFDGIPNVQVILSVDKDQLQHTVKQIYGEGTSAEKYLAKFIDFEIKLDEGIIKDFFAKRFKDYTKYFENRYQGTKSIDAEQFMTLALDGLDMRRRIAIIDKCQLIHNIISEESTMDSSIMCMEVLLVLLFECKIDLERAKTLFNITNIFQEKNEKGHGWLLNATSGMKKISNRYSLSKPGGGKYYNKESNSGNCYIYSIDIWGNVLGGYRYIIGYTDDCWMYGDLSKDEFVGHVKKFWEILQIIN